MPIKGFDKGYYNGVRIIAEVKLWSPLEGQLTEQSFEERLELAGAVGPSMVSIHTNPDWHGNPKDITRARKRLPSWTQIMAKGWHGTDDEVCEVFDCGADFALGVGRLPRAYADRCIIEPLDFKQLLTIPDNRMALWNSRQLATLKDIPGLHIPKFILEYWHEMGNKCLRDKEPFWKARQAKTRRDGWLCQASNLKTVDDIEPGADAVLVGTHLESFAQSLGISV